MQTPKVIICIPAFNEGKNIAAIVNKAKAYGTEVVVCDDGSVDDTRDQARNAGALVIRHAENKGYGSAIRTLFRVAKERMADIMITMDSDGQHDPEQIPALLQPIIKDEYDMVIGSRFLTESDKQRVPMYRSLGIKTITRLTQVVSYGNLTDAQSGFRAYSKNALASIELTEEGMAVSTEILIKAKRSNLTIKEVPVTIRYDVEDSSTHNPVQHGLAVTSSVVRFISLRHPLAFYGIPGVAFLIVASVFMTNALDLFSQTRFVSTNMIIISIGSAVIGIVLLVTGVILNTLAALLRERLRD